MEPEGRDIHIDTIRDEVWQHAYRTSPEPGRKVFVIREADRLSPPAADTLLKVLEEPPADTVFLLLSARAHELPDTIASRCHVVGFAALPESFVVSQLEGEGVDPAGRSSWRGSPAATWGARAGWRPTPTAWPSATSPRPRSITPPRASPAPWPRRAR